MIKRELLYGLEKNQYFDATDLMQKVIDGGKKLIHYASPDYWLDVGSAWTFKRPKVILKYSIYDARICDHSSQKRFKGSLAKTPKSSGNILWLPTPSWRQRRSFSRAYSYQRIAKISNE